MKKMLKRNKMQENKRKGQSKGQNYRRDFFWRDFSQRVRNN